MGRAFDFNRKDYFLRNQQVAGSIPAISSNFPRFLGIFCETYGRENEYFCWILIKK